ncbi:MAG: glycosyltransferase involved in cell wall biosynthesis [Candidatus Azotimanducaceae bacterium]|jgi:glycosyltransferase involved in cell wall biosynthesis
MLEACIDSVRKQTYPCTHILVADGESQDWLTQLSVQHLKLSANHADYGDTPRGVGSVSAINQGFDAVTYLDADNWYQTDHIHSLVSLHQRTGAAVCTSRRNLHRLDGTLLGPCTGVDGERFTDTNCLLLTKIAFEFVPLWWSIPADLHCIGDRIMWRYILNKDISRAHSDQTTVAYRTAFKSHYLSFGEKPPPGSKTGEEIAYAMKRLGDLKQSWNKGAQHVKHD